MYDMRNVAIWWDGTLRSLKGHHGNCRWAFDGQIHYHLPIGEAQVMGFKRGVRV